MEKSIDYNSIGRSKSEPIITEINFSDTLDTYKNYRKKAQEGDIREFGGDKFQRKSNKWALVKNNL